jgi:soluble lytic murein transglycosylase
MVFLFLWFFIGHTLYADTSVLDAKTAFLEKRNADLSLLMKNASQSLLEPYFLYWDALLRLPVISLDEATGIWQRLDGTPLANMFAAKWLEEMAKSGQDQWFLSFYPRLSEPSYRFQCYEQKAKKTLGLPTDEKKISQIWNAPQMLGPTCLNLFTRLKDDARLSADQILKRVRLLLFAGQINAAKESALLLPDGAGFAIKLQLASKNPKTLLQRTTVPADPADKLLVIYALKRVGDLDFAAAQAAFSRLSPYFSEEEQDWIVRAFALSLARDHDPRALSWFKKALVLSDEERGWQVRQALRVEDWQTVALAIDHMSLQAKQAWYYWRAKAAVALGDIALANQLFLKEAANEEGFYTFLAAEKIGSMPEKIYWAAAENLRFQLPLSAQRAFLLYGLGLFEEADREWRYTLARENPQTLLALAYKAKEQQWWKAAIAAARKSGLNVASSFFYPTPYLDLVKRYASSNNIDEAWVLGLMRQESLFDSHARSFANARGLMQIIPPTGKWIAKRLGMPFDVSILNDPETNIAFGTHYMRYALDYLGHKVLATAGYNAGPGRPKQWLASHPLDGAIYIESIPFDETRDYVKKVLANTLIYSRELNNNNNITLSAIIGELPVGN